MKIMKEMLLLEINLVMFMLFLLIQINQLQKKLVPILGHVSMLTDVLIGKFNNKEFIISTDRDEHIRISNYPKSYVIKDFYLDMMNLFHNYIFLNIIQRF